jgi:putative membrane protein
METLQNPQDDPRVELAIERTLLAWIRTGIAMMGLGFVVARFSLFLKELAVSSAALEQSPGLSLWIGVALLALGVYVDLMASWTYYRNVQRKKKGLPPIVLGTVAGTSVGIMLAGLAILMVTYLIVLGSRS